MNWLKISELAPLCKWDEPMARYTSLKVGGKARGFFSPKSATDLIDFFKLNSVQSEPLAFCTLGLGSNLLIRDGGFDGVVISTKAVKSIEKCQGKKPKLWVDCGTGLAKLAHFGSKMGFDSLNFLVGIPGSLGGALAMNAGCHQMQIWDWVEQLEWLSSEGEIERLSIEDFEIGYRLARIKKRRQGIFLRALLRLEKINAQDLNYFIQWRAQNQPIDKPNCGSVFKNPKTGFSAGYYIDKAGLKGFRLGKAEISKKHANFIITQRETSASEVENLICHIQNEIQNQFGVSLVQELVIAGNPNGEYI